MNFASIDLEQLSGVTGGADAPAPPPPPPQPRGGGNSTQWIQNTATCTRIGGPILGAICGVMTPSPAY